MNVKLFSRILWEWVRRKKPPVMHSVQIRRLRWGGVFGKRHVFFELQGDKLAMIGGACDSLVEEQAPVIALLREISEELCLDFGLSPETIRNLKWGHSFSTVDGFEYTVFEDGRIKLGPHAVITPLGEVVSHLPFGIKVKTHFFDVVITRSFPKAMVEQPGFKKPGVEFAFKASPSLRKGSTIVVVREEEDGSTLAEHSQPSGWRAPSEYFLVTPPAIPSYYFSREPGWQSGKELDEDEAKAFINGKFFPLGTGRDLFWEWVVPFGAVVIVVIWHVLIISLS